ncbi:MAG TPA: hypothetical protein VKA21_16955, partial [Candidatus Binatia bacterium]|nr:hypothetical protein [Candidatus Binatia bacterium]
MVTAMRGYRLLDTVVAVTVDAPPIAAWLDEFLLPSFLPWTGEAADFAVRVRTEAAAHDAIAARRPPGTLAARPVFALDREVVSHPSWIQSGRTVLADERYGTFYVVGDEAVEVVADPRVPLFRSGPMRVVREIATARVLADPTRLQLHAAALEVDGRAILIAGAKGAGKTTLLAYLAGAPRARILGNDRALLARRDGAITVRGVPTIVSVRPETRALLPALFGGLAALPRPS